MFQTNVVEEIKTHILCSAIFFFFEKSCHFLDNGGKMLDRGQPQMKIQHMRIACWLPMSTNTQYENTAHAHCMLVTYVYKHTI